MSASRGFTIWVIVGVIGLIAAMVAIFYANEARKEVYFLCSNFTSGISYTSVIGQLDTANLSDYKVIAAPEGKRLEFSSRLNLRIVQCTIEFDRHNKVVSALYN